MKTFRLTITTWQQVTEHSIGQILDFNERCPKRLVNMIRSHHIRIGAYLKGTCWSDEALTEIAVAIGVLEHGDTGLQSVLLPCNPLLGTTSGPQHQPEGDRRLDIEMLIRNWYVTTWFKPFVRRDMHHYP
jgi:hypothetical protein